MASAPPVNAVEATPGGGLGKWLIFAAVLAAVVGGGYRWMARRQQPSPPVQNPAAAAAAVDPEPYRESIQIIEKALYAPAPATLSDANILEEQADALSQRLTLAFRYRSPEPLAKLETFTRAVGASTQALTFDPLARKDWIRLWEEVRSALFAPAPWMHPAVRVNEAVQAIPLVDAALDLQRTDAQLAGLIQSARTETAEFGEREVDMHDRNDPDAQRRLERWRAWVTGWTPRVDQALASLPPFVRMPPSLQDAHRLLERIALHLKAVPNPGPGVFLTPDNPVYKALYLPRRFARDEWINQADYWLTQARDMIKSAQGGPS